MSGRWQVFVGLGLALALADLLVRVVPVWISAPACVLLPLALLPRWRRLAGAEQWESFRRLKLVLLPASLLAGLLVMKGVVPASPAAGWLFSGLMIVNVAPVLALELRRGQRINALAGALLLAAMPPLQPLEPTPIGLAIPLPWLWVIAYSIWHQAFLHHYRAGRLSVRNIVFLAVPLATSTLIGVEHWLMARCSTVTMGTLAVWSLGRGSTRALDTPELADQPLLAALPGVALLLSALALLCRLYG